MSEGVPVEVVEAFEEQIRDLLTAMSEKVPGLAELVIFGNSEEELLFSTRVSIEEGKEFKANGNRYFLASTPNVDVAIGMDDDVLKEKHPNCTVDEIEEEKFWELFQDENITSYIE